MGMVWAALLLQLLDTVGVAAQPAQRHLQAEPGGPPPSTLPPLPWAVNTSCLAACEGFCSKDASCRAISFGRNFNHGLQCNFHLCANLTEKRDSVLWVTFTKNSRDGYTQHNWSITTCPNPNRPPLTDYKCMSFGPDPGPPSPPRPSPAPRPPPPPPKPLNNCSKSQLNRSRHASLWLPGVAPGRGADTARYLQAHVGSYDTLSMTWSYWNSKWNSKCNDTQLGREYGLCGRAWSEDEQMVIAAAKTLRMRIVPILEVCCVCVLNASYDYAPGMQALVADAKQEHFSGFVLDMVCGGHDEPQRAIFLDAFKRSQGEDKTVEVSWFSHGTMRANVLTYLLS